MNFTQKFFEHSLRNFVFEGSDDKSPPSPNDSEAHGLGRASLHWLQCGGWGDVKVGVEMCSIGLYLEDHPRYLPTRIVPPGFFFQISHQKNTMEIPIRSMELIHLPIHEWLIFMGSTSI